ncbi:MAG: PEP-CTERM sorting domain-containing protein [Planctomycetia bacterium]|nr:PEP-CTERM sorting domain-containing protein [Planctomycetia bacterium]
MNGRGLSRQGQIFNRFHGLFLLALSGALLTSGVQAAVQTAPLNDPAAPRNTGWSIEYDDSQVQFLSFTGIAGTGNLEGSLSITKVFSDMNPISIKFIEGAAQQANGSPFGLRINLDEEITNLTGQNWCGFAMDLVDPSPVSDSANSGHPGFAHFHPAPAINGPPFTLTTPNNGNKAAGLLFESPGVFSDGTTESWGTFGLHQYEDNGVDRSFTLVETPYPCVPEPSTLTLAAMAVVGMAVTVRRRRAA